MKKVSHLIALAALAAVTMFTACEKNNIYEEDMPSKESVQTVSINYDNNQDRIERIKQYLMSTNAQFRSTTLKDEIVSEYDLINQQIVSSETKKSKVIMLQNKKDKNKYLSLYEDEDGYILNSKISYVRENNNGVNVSFYDLSGVKYFELGGNTANNTLSVLNFNEDVFGSKSGTRRTHSVGCSAAMFAAGAPWSVGFGMVNPLAGLAAAAVFWALSEVMC